MIAILTPSPNTAIIPKINNILSFGDVMKQITLPYIIECISTLFQIY